MIYSSKRFKHFIKKCGAIRRKQASNRLIASMIHKSTGITAVDMIILNYYLCPNDIIDNIINHSDYSFNVKDYTLSRVMSYFGIKYWCVSGNINYEGNIIIRVRAYRPTETILITSSSFFIFASEYTKVHCVADNCMFSGYQLKHKSEHI